MDKVEWWNRSTKRRNWASVFFRFKKWTYLGSKPGLRSGRSVNISYGGSASTRSCIFVQK